MVSSTVVVGQVVVVRDMEDVVMSDAVDVTSTVVVPSMAVVGPTGVVSIVVDDGSTLVVITLDVEVIMVVGETVVDSTTVVFG